MKPLLSPSGTGDLRDRVVTTLWDGYARAHRGTAPTPPRLLATSATAAELAGEAERCRRELLENVLPFWREHAIDRRHGGYLVHLARDGSVYDERTKYSAMQARMVYAFSVGELVAPNGGDRALAEQGVRFLCKHHWDERSQGWVRTVDRAGTLLDDTKYTFDQAYTMIGLCAWLRVAPDDAEARGRLEATLLFVERLWDETRLGYLESADRDVTVRTPRKTICVELDMLAALLDCDEVLGRGGDRARLLADLIAGRMRDPRHGCALEYFDPDWRYDPFPTRDRIEIGHNLKAAWFLLEAHRRFGNDAHRRAAFELVDFCLKFGWDDRRGGFYQDVSRAGTVWSTDKLWWPQTEGLAVLSRMLLATGDGKYLGLYRRLVAFVGAAFQDPIHGGWIYSARADGSAKDDRKGANFKAALHETQGWHFSGRCFAALSNDAAIG